MSNTPKRPDVEGIKARLNSKDRYIGHGGLAGQHLDALIAHIEALEDRMEKLEAVVVLVEDGNTGRAMDLALAALGGEDV